MNLNNKEDYNMAEDKIINNSFNSGEMQFQEFTQSIKIDSRVSSLYDDQLGDVIEHRTLHILNEKIYEIFKNSPYHKKYKNPKRVDKTDMINMYYYFKERCGTGEYSPVEIFISFAECFQLNYDQLYKGIGVLDQELVLRDFVAKNKMENRIKTKKLF